MVAQELPQTVQVGYSAAAALKVSQAKRANAEVCVVEAAT